VAARAPPLPPRDNHERIDAAVTTTTSYTRGAALAPPLPPRDDHDEIDAAVAGNCSCVLESAAAATTTLTATWELAATKTASVTAAAVGRRLQLGATATAPAE
jgi:hypothetical protein